MAMRNIQHFLDMLQPEGSGRGLFIGYRKHTSLLEEKKMKSHDREGFVASYDAS